MRCLLLLVMTLCSSALLTAQTFQASVLAGTNISQIEGDDLYGFHKFGLNGGIRVVAKLNDRWRVGPEILFTQSGSRRPVRGNSSRFTRFHFNKLEVPLMVYYKDWRFVAETGFSYQRLFSYEIDNARREDISEMFALKDNLFAFNIGVTLYATENIGINFRWSKHIIDLDIDDAINTSLRGQTISLRMVWTPGAGETLPRPTIQE